MITVYENEITKLGKNVTEFDDGGMFICFGPDVPPELEDYVYSVSVNPVAEEIKPGMILKVDDNEYRITAVGEEVMDTLSSLGHLTVRLSGDSTAELPGTLYVEEDKVPEMKVGTKISIIKM